MSAHMKQKAFSSVVARGLVLAFLLFGTLNAAIPDEQSTAISEEKVISATWSMYTWKVLGWQYYGPYWTKGTEEKGRIGEKGQQDKEKNVRAVCLGPEGDFYVFFTLRSFVDPAFPNIFVQNVSEIPLDPNGDGFSEDKIEKESYIRYGGVSLVFYEDKGGGTLNVSSKVKGITHFDEKNPKCYNRKVAWVYNKPIIETIDNVKYERPHDKISAKEHLDMQKGEKIAVKYVGDHDVALLYIPKTMLSGGQPINSLGINNPTLSVRLMLENNRELFGFRFVLVGQETIDLVKNYNPLKLDVKDANAFQGFKKLFMVAGLALGPETLDLLKKVDVALDAAIPQEVAESKNLLEAGKVGWDLSQPIIEKIKSDPTALVDIGNRIKRSLSETGV